MSRRPKNYRRVIEPDAIYNSGVLSKFINILMIKGKKSIAEGIVYEALERLGKNTGESAIQAFEKALKNVTPQMEVKSRRVGGSTYQVPVDVRPERGVGLAMRWIIGNARSRSGRSMVDKLSTELEDAFNNVGSSAKKKEDTHKMAEANKAFAHFRW